VRLIFKGREIVHKDIGADVLKRFASVLEDVAQIDQDIAFSGREVNMILAPKKEKGKDKNAEGKDKEERSEEIHSDESGQSQKS